MFLVPKSDGSQRPVFNLKSLNRFLEPKQYRLFSHFKIPDFLQKGAFMVKLDLHQAYFHVPVKQSHRRFLALAYGGKMFTMTCLPFGLSSAPQVFASLSNWVASYLRNQGVRIVVYLDDFLIVSQSQKIAKHHAHLAVQVLEFLGWTINHEKSQLDPQHEIEFLGIIWNPEQNVKRVPMHKKKSIIKKMENLERCGDWNWKQSKSLLGSLNFVAFVVPFGRIHCRRMQRERVFGYQKYTRQRNSLSLRKR
nr:unnamed protein product [Callosobruchus analis]